MDYTEVRYIELKTGYGDNGPAWIGKVKLSKTKRTIYFNNKAFRQANCCSGNYFDVETGEEYWISGIKMDGTDRHWAGSGKIIIGRNIVEYYLSLRGRKTLDKRKYIVRDIPEIYPIERINTFCNEKLYPEK